MKMGKSKSTPSSIVVAVDVGTTKICVLVAQYVSQGGLEIIGIGKSPSYGLARGVVVNIKPTIESIRAAVREAELMSGIAIESASIGISGSHVQARNSQGVVGIKQGEIRQSDMDHVISAAKAIPLPEGQQILHVLPQFYIIDGNHKVRDPLGMFGIRLEAQVHIISGALSSVQNLVRCCEMAGLKVRDIILEPLASAEAVLSEDEKELGAFMLDIGGGTSDFAFYQQGTIRHTKVVPIAGNLFTQDLALCLRTTMADAERVKKTYGCSFDNPAALNDIIEIEKIQGGEKHAVTGADVAEVINARASELFDIIKVEMATYKLRAPAGLILTGGGALLDGVRAHAEKILAIPVRVGCPKITFGFQESLNNPIYATGYGLLVYAVNKHKIQAFDRLEGPFVGRVITRMKSWVGNFF